MYATKTAKKAKETTESHAAMKTGKHGIPRLQDATTAGRVGIGEWKAVRVEGNGQGVRPPSNAGEFLSDEETVMETATLSTENRGRVQQGEYRIGRPKPGGPLLKTNQAATYLAISPRQVQYLSKRGELACVRIGNSTRFTTADLDDFVGRHRRSGGQG